MPSAYYRFFIGDYVRKTKGLSMLQHGAYRLLIDEYMDHRGPLPNDLERLCNALRAQSVEERSAVEFILGEFFVMKKNVFLHNRCDEELTHIRERSEKAKESVRLRELKRSSNDHRTITDGSSIQNQNQNQISSKSKEELVPIVSSLHEVEIITAHNAKKTRVDRGTRRGNWFPGPEGTEFCRECRPDLNPMDVFQKFADYWDSVPGQKGRKLDWMATWRNWVRSTERARA